MARDCSQHKMLPDRSAVATAASARAVSTPLPSLDRERAVLSDVTQDIRVRLRHNFPAHPLKRGLDLTKPVVALHGERYGAGGERMIARIAEK